MGNFLLIDLADVKTKKVAETITSATSRRILDHLTQGDDTEKGISEKLKMAISTVHYHLQKLLEAGLVVVEEFHYSKKGREVNHYKLANKYIIIAPKVEKGLKEKLRSILPAGLLVGGIGVVWGLVEMFTGRLGMFSGSSKTAAMQRTVMEAAPMAMDASEEMAAEMVIESAVSSEPMLWLWFLVGALSVVVAYLIWVFIREKF